MALNRSQKRQDDPTGQAKRRNRATLVLETLLAKAEKQIKAEVRQIPSARRMVTPLPNRSTVVYDYLISPAQQATLEADIRRILDDELETTGDFAPPGWYWVDQVEPPYRQATFEEINRFNQILAAAIIAGAVIDPFATTIEPEQVVNTSQYQTELRRVIVRNYGDIKTLSDRTAAQVIQQINNDISAGTSPRLISRNISRRFDVADSNAKRIADTEINRSYNDGKLNTANIIKTRTGQRVGVLHISALLPSTREAHAARHGNVYTVEDQERWWDTGANRINCKCSTAIALIDSKGRVTESEDQATLKAERKFFEREN